MAAERDTLSVDQLGSKGRLNVGRQMSRGPHGGLGAIGSANLAQDGFDMNFDGRFSHIELTSNDLVGRTVGQAMQDLRLAG